MENNKLVELVTKCQNGDNAAMNELFTRYYNDVYYFALKTIKDSDIACDITQETFLEITLTIGNLKAPAAFVTWMKQIAYHQCTRYFKKKKDLLVDEDEDGNSILDTIVDESEDSVPSAVYEKEEFRKTILGMIDELSEEQRSAVMMLYFDELSVKQIAEIQGVSEGTVKSRLNYARKAIKKSVEDYEEKHGIKLHSIALLPLLRMFFDGKGTMPEANFVAIRKTIMEAAAKNAVSAVAATAAQAPTSATLAQAASNISAGMGFFAKLAKLPLVTKIIAALISAAVVTIGVVSAVTLTDNGSQSETDDSDRTGNGMHIIEDHTSGEGNNVPGNDITTGAHVHSWSDWSTLIAATCTTEGQQERICSCGEKEIQAIFTLAHTVVVTPGKSATCTQVGLSNGKYCSVCNTVIEQQTEIAVTDHSFSSGECTGCGMFERVSEGLDIRFDSSKGYYYVAGIGSCKDSEIFIPSMYKGFPVIEIGYGAFRDISGFTSIAIPNSITSIHMYAFHGCRDLTSVTIGKGVTSIEENTFSECTSLTNVTIGKGVTSIGDKAFSECTSLQSVIIPDSVTSIGDNAFYKCTSLQSVIIPDSVTSIGKEAFYVCNLLTSVTIGNGVTHIGENAFYECTSLTNITIPSSVTGIGPSAFYNCTNLTNVTIGEGMLKIGYAAFSNCTSLKSIIIPDSVTSIGWYAFSSCKNLTSVTIGNGVTSIGGYAFAYCKSLESLTVPDSVRIIDIGAFSYCNSLISVTIGNGVAYIAEYAFYECKNLTNITIPEGVTSIGEFAFYNCTNLVLNEYDNAYYLGNNTNPFVVLVEAKSTEIRSCMINENTKVIYTAAFDDCKSLMNIIIPEGVTNIGAGAFYECTSLTNITIPDSVNIIGYEAFSNCMSLAYNEYDNAYYLGNITNPYVVLVKVKSTDVKSCKINENTKVIYQDAFSACTSLTSITIPDSVTSIGDNAFEACNSLVGVTIGNGVTNIGGYAFAYCKGIKSLTIPDSVTSIGYGAFYYCSLLASINIPDNVMSIGDETFKFCRKLKSVTIGKDVIRIGKEVFYYCELLESITFNGTKEQWNDIGKGVNWDFPMRKYDVECTDGTIGVNYGFLK